MNAFNPHKHVGPTHFGQAAKAPAPVTAIDENQQQAEDDEPGGAEGEGETPEPVDSGEAGLEIDNIESLEGAEVGSADDEEFESFADPYEPVAANEAEDVPGVGDPQDHESVEDADGDAEDDDLSAVAATADAAVEQEASNGQHEAAGELGLQGDGFVDATTEPDDADVEEADGVVASSNTATADAMVTAGVAEHSDAGSANTGVSTGEVSTPDAHDISADKSAGVGAVATAMLAQTGSGAGNFHDGNSPGRSLGVAGSVVFALVLILTIIRDVKMRPVDDKTVDRYTDALKDGGELPRILIFEDFDPATGTSERRLADGQHRLAAHVKAGRTHIEAEIRQGNRRDAMLAMAASNNGLLLTNKQKHELAYMMVGLCPDWTDNRIRTHTGLSIKVISDERERYNKAHGTDPRRLSNRGRKPKVKELELAPDTTVEPTLLSVQPPQVQAQPTRQRLPQLPLPQEEAHPNQDNGGAAQNTRPQAIQASIQQEQPGDTGRISLPATGDASSQGVARVSTATDDDQMPPKKRVRDNADGGVDMTTGVASTVADENWRWVMGSMRRNLQDAFDKGAQKATVKATVAEIINSIWGEEDEAGAEG